MKSLNVSFNKKKKVKVRNKTSDVNIGSSKFNVSASKQVSTGYNINKNIKK